MNPLHPVRTEWQPGDVSLEEIERVSGMSGTWEILSEEASPLDPALVQEVVAKATHAWQSRRHVDRDVAYPDQALLFSVPQWTTVVDELPRTRPLQAESLDNIVKQAYIACNQGMSTDRLSCDTEAVARFVQACWKLGAQATQFELLWSLFGARKANKIGKVPGVERASVPRAELERYLWASEIALRIIQDEAYFHRQVFVSLDKILCHPRLASEFEAVARRLAPGYKSLDYRWAALTIRKSQQRSVSNAVAARATFEPLGLMEDVRASSIPSAPGLFWLNSNDRDLLVGRSDNLRNQFEQLMQTPDGGWRMVPDWLVQRVSPYKQCGLGKVRIATLALPGRSDHRDGLARSFATSAKTLFNSLAGCLPSRVA